MTQDNKTCLPAIPVWQMNLWVYLVDEKIITDIKQSWQIPYEVVPTMEQWHHAHDVMIDNQLTKLHTWLLLIFYLTLATLSGLSNVCHFSKNIKCKFSKRCIFWSPIHKKKYFGDLRRWKSVQVAKSHQVHFFNSTFWSPMHRKSILGITGNQRSQSANFKVVAYSFKEM